MNSQLIDYCPIRRKKCQTKIGQNFFGPFFDLCMSSLCRDNANLLCIVPILSDVPEGTSIHVNILRYKLDKEALCNR
ncbi:hypothetical protein H5410_034911 [Solanum commersonii]|uniref:Uncharacterized protein n=1 Tax=Solanum commersonii TaxID=4109 RepID=A0A9J5Y1E4_SOLCO|nr:hypothetical protein H5410_034911 [Solanum commersonii]